jgi:hypothetical protein
MIDAGELDEVVECMYRRANAGADQVLSPLALARKLYGPSTVQWVRNQIAPGECGRTEDQVYIGLRAGLPMTIARHLCGHELGHLELGMRGSGEPDIELACDYIGAAIMTRRRPFARRACGRERDFKQLALDFGSSETLVALRIGEVLRLPVAVVAPHVVRARGDAQWPDEQRVREFARKGAAGLSRVRLTDDRRRVALVGDEAA